MQYSFDEINTTKPLKCCAHTSYPFDVRSSNEKKHLPDCVFFFRCSPICESLFSVFCFLLSTFPAPRTSGGGTSASCRPPSPDRPASAWRHSVTARRRDDSWRDDCWNPEIKNFNLWKFFDVLLSFGVSL